MTKVKFIISDPWDFITRDEAVNDFTGSVYQINDFNTEFWALLDQTIEYKGKKFSKVVCSTRYLNQKFIWQASESQPCAIIGVPDNVFDEKNPFAYNFHSMVNLLGSFVTK